MPVPIVYRQGGAATASYDWVDLTSGAGYKRFYACGFLDSTGTVYALIPKVIDAAGDDNGNIDRAGLATSNDGAGSELTINFDITFGKPATIAAADAFFTFTVKIANTHNSTAKIQVYHVTSGGTTTSLGSTTGAARGPTNASYTYVREAIKVTLTAKSFGVGEKLRVTYSTSATDNKVTIYHDPSGRITFNENTLPSVIDSSFLTEIPFKIDL